MRDITDDLRERLRQIDAEYADEMAALDERLVAHRHTIAELNRQRSVVQAALGLEAQRSGGSAEDGAAAIVRARLPLEEFVITKVHALGPLDKDALKAEAGRAGYPEAENGRSFHMTLTNVIKHKKLRQLPDGRYAYPERPDAGLFAAGDASQEAPMMQ